MKAGKTAQPVFDIDHLRKWDQKIDARRVSLIRKAYKLSEKDFAERLGVTLKTLRNWETGLTNPTGPRRRLLTVYWKGFRPMKSSEVIARTKAYWDIIPVMLVSATTARKNEKLVFEHRGG